MLYLKNMNVLRAPRNVLMPVILLFCVVGSFAINITVFGERIEGFHTIGALLILPGIWLSTRR